MRRPSPAFFLGSILLEPHRWMRGRPAAIRLVTWLDGIRAAGFEGIELWERHWHEASATDRETLRNCGLRFLLNSYATLSPAAEDERRRTADAAHALRAEGVKFNLGPDPARFPHELEILRAWSGTLPPSCRLLCECHDGTAAESPDLAARLAGTMPPGTLDFILHPFFTPQPQRWVAALGSRIVHWHVQTRAEDDVHRFVALGDRPAWIADRLRELPGARPATVTIEFTRGVAEPEENVAALLQHAQADRDLLATLLSS